MRTKPTKRQKKPTTYGQYMNSIFGTQVNTKKKNTTGLNNNTKSVWRQH